MISKQKLKVWRKILIPDAKEMKWAFRLFLGFMLFFTFIQLFQYSSTQVKAQSEQINQTRNGGGVAFFDLVTDTFMGKSMLPCTGDQFVDTLWNIDYGVGNPNCKQTGISGGIDNFFNTEESQPGGMLEVDLGATGRLINSSSFLYQQNSSPPGQSVQYYAQQLKGEAYAAGTDGKSMLAPIYTLHRAFLDLGYGLVVVILLISSLSAMMGFFSGAEQKVTISQLTLNALLTIFFMSIYYEASAIILDITVNWGNSLVASFMSPYINAKFVLERLQPGGDLSITNILTTFQSTGTSPYLTYIAKQALTGLTPAVTQTIGAFTENAVNDLPLVGAWIGTLNGIGGGAVSYGASTLISSLTGSQAVFNSIIAFAFFFINLKIWINLLVAFITYNIYTAFGSLLMLAAINKGYDSVKNSFKTLFALALVFPLTFLFIMLAAASINFFIRDGAAGSVPASGGVEQTVICSDSPNARGDEGFIDRGIGGTSGPGATSDPTAFKRVNTDFQTILDGVPAYIKNGIKSCFNKLFPLPSVTVPAPYGNFFNGATQGPGINALIRLSFTIGFLVLASRTPDISKEFLGVQEMRSLSNIGKVFNTALSASLGAAGVGLSMGPSIGFGLARFGLTKVPIPGVGKLGDYAEKLGNSVRGSGGSLKMAPVSSLMGRLGGSPNFAGAVKNYDDTRRGLIGAGMGAPEAGKVALENLALTFGKATEASSIFSTATRAAAAGARELEEALKGIGNQIKTFAVFSGANDI